MCQLQLRQHCELHLSLVATALLPSLPVGTLPYAVTPVSEGSHRAVYSFRKLTDGLGRQQKENAKDLAFFFFL